MTISTPFISFSLYKALDYGRHKYLTVANAFKTRVYKHEAFMRRSDTLVIFTQICT